MNPLHFFTRLFLMAGLCTMMFGTLLADGNETLGPPSIPIATGSGYVASGVGLTLAQPGIININVPVLSTIKQVLLYWEGQHYSGFGDNTIIVNGIEIPGVVIGGPNFFFGTPQVYSTTFRADITALNIVQLGANALSVEGLTFERANNGAGVLVIFDDGTGLSNIQLRDGNDLAYKFFPAPRTETVAQTFTFPASAVARVGKIKMFFSSVEGTVSTGQQRPNRVAVTVNGVTTNHDNVLNSNDGEEWDTYQVDVNIPAGATSVTMQAISGPGGSASGSPDPRPASLAWIVGGLSVPPPCSGRIGDFVWKDCDGNGIQDPGEAGIAGVTVYLKDSNGNTIATSVTDANGFYFFEDLCAGNFIVEVDESTMPPGLTQTTCSNAPGIANNSNCSPSPVTLTTDQSEDLTIDFGYKGTGIIGDFVWRDEDCDGIQDVDEPGIPGVRVWLKKDGVTVQTVITDADGKYEFTDMCGGDYVVEVDESTLPPGYTRTTCDNTANIADNSNCSPSNVTITDGQTDRTIDFGYCPPDEACPSTELGPDGNPLASMKVTIDPNGDVNVQLDQSVHLNDNSYGTNAIGWGGANKHKFTELVGSDKLQLVFYNANGQKVLDIVVDYISAKSGTPSGYASLGVSGGEGKVNFGSAANVLLATTSLASNLNTTGYCVGGNCTVAGINLLVNSPPADNDYNVTNPVFNQWNFVNSYFVKISAAAFGASGFGKVVAGDVHNSPSKGGRKVKAFSCPDVPSSNVCEGGVKPGTLRMVYTGSDCSASNNTQGGKATCADHAALQSTVRILVTDKSNPADSKAKKWFDGVRNLGDTIEVKASNGGATKFSADSYYFIYSTGGQLLQSGKFHTSCSQPLEIGNQFGSLRLTGFKPEGVPKMVEDLEGMPEAFRLLQNYPNPFNPSTEIYFQMPEGGDMTLKIFNTLGQEIKSLVNGYMEAGIHGVTWDATDNNGNAVSSGIYFYQMRSGEFTSMKKMSLLR